MQSSFHERRNDLKEQGKAEGGEYKERVPPSELKKTSTAILKQGDRAMNFHRKHRGKSIHNSLDAMVAMQISRAKAEDELKAREEEEKEKKGK